VAGVLIVKPKAAGMTAARAVTRVMYFIVMSEGAREVSLGVQKSHVVEEKMDGK
jgi:hypothetical protein